MMAITVEGFSFKNVTHALFQARMWREYATAWGGGPDRSGVGRRWLEEVGHNTRDECIARARIACLAARLLNQQGD